MSNNDEQAPTEAAAVATPRPVDFEAMHPRVGCGMQLVQSRGGHESRFASALIGFVAQEYVIVKRPVDARGLAIKVEIGQLLAVHLFTGTEVIGFEATLLRQFGTPFAAWHLEYPRSVRVQVLRAAPRLAVTLEATVTCAAAPEGVAARVADLSVSGALLVCDRQLGEPPAALEIVVRVPQLGAADVDLVIQASLRSVRGPQPAGGAAGMFRCGVQFDDLPPASMAVLQQFIATHPRA